MTKQDQVVYWTEERTREGHQITRTVNGYLTLPEELYGYGERVVLLDQRWTPLPASLLWSGFDDYLTIQKGLTYHEDTILEPGPRNGPGAHISFANFGSRTYEELLIKDDVNLNWKIRLPRPNPIFSFYEATISMRDGPDGSEGYAMLDGILIEKDDQKRHDFLKLTTGVWPERIRELADYIAERDGVRLKQEFIIKNSLEKMWSIVGNWSDVSWVMDAVNVKVDDETQPARTITFEDGNEMYEFQKELDNDKHRLVYVIEKSKTPMPYYLYKGTVTLSNVPENEVCVKVNYDSLILLKEGVKPDTTLPTMEANLQSRFRYLQKKFGN